MKFTGQPALMAKKMDDEKRQRVDGGRGNLVYLPEKI